MSIPLAILFLNLTVMGEVPVLGDMEAGQSAYAFFVAGHIYGQPDRDDGLPHPPFLASIPPLNKLPNLAFGVLTVNSIDQAEAHGLWLDQNSSSNCSKVITDGS